jgi:hypothetical protein
MWPHLRSEELTQSAIAIFSKARIRITLIPSSTFKEIAYFPEDYSTDCQAALDPVFQYVPPDRSHEDVDIVILTAHGADLSQVLWDIRKKISPRSLTAVWFWDNHLSHMPNLRTTMAADFVFPSHKYIANYLVGPASVFGSHVPLCCAQWKRDEISQYFDRFQHTTRSSKLLVNYIDYPFSPRTHLLRHLKAHMSEANVLLMDPSDRTRYFSKTRLDRFREWMEHKSTLILPMDRDLSTRIFDSLLAGQVLLVPNIIPDFDEVISPTTQAQLGIIKLQRLEIGVIREAAAHAARIFDEMGIDGARARHRYVLDNHMMVHRMRTMLDCIKSVAARQVSVVFDGNSTTPYGLHLTAAT